MSQRRRGLLGRIVDGLRGIVGGGRRQPPPPPRQEPEVEYEPPPPPPPPPPPIISTPPIPERGNVVYIPTKYTQVASHSKYGKAFNYSQTILGRWSVGSDMNPADIYDVRDLLNQSGKQGWTNIVIGGTYPTPYPGQEGQAITWISYSYQMQNLEDFADDPNHNTATDWMNALLVGTTEHWEEVFIVQVVDR